MRELLTNNKFLQDLDRVKKTVASNNDSTRFGEEISLVIGRLLFKVSLDAKYKDHPLNGDWKGYRDCHVFNDLVLVYKVTDKNSQDKKLGDNALVLARIGSHSEIFK